MTKEVTVTSLSGHLSVRVYGQRYLVRVQDFKAERAACMEISLQQLERLREALTRMERVE